MSRTWLKTGIIFGAVILIGRISGLVRELLIAHKFGASDTADQLVILLTFPDILTGILGTAALLYILVPRFRRIKEAELPVFFSQVSVVALLAFAVVAFLVSIFAVPLAGLLAPGFSNSKAAILHTYIPLFSLMIPITALASIATARLHSVDNFAISGLGTLVVNGAIICGVILTFWFENNIFFVVGMSVLIGGCLRLMMQLLVVGQGMVWQSPFQKSLLTSSLARAYFQALISGSLFLLLPVFARVIASQEQGGVALFNYSIKLAELPMGIAVAIIPVMLLPKMASALQAAKSDKAEDLSRDTIFANLALSLAIGLPGAWFAPTIVSILYGWGAFSASDLAAMSLLVTYALAGLSAHGLVSHFLSVLHAAQKVGIVLIAAILAAASFWALSLLLFRAIGLLGLIFALYLTYLICALMMSLATAKSLNWGLSSVGFSKLNLKLIALNIVLLLLIWLISSLLSSSIVIDVIVGSIWFGLSLAGALVIYMRDRNLNIRPKA